MELYDTLKRLADLPGPSGHIGAVAAEAGKLMTPMVNEIRRDKLNNIYGIRRCGKADAKMVLLDAHLDEIGFIVTGHEEGFLRFTTIGGVDPRMLPSRELYLMGADPGFGIVATKPPHVMTDEEYEQVSDIDDLRIDVGLSQEEALARYPIGTTAVYRESLRRLQGSRVTGKALDDRAGFAVLLRVLDILSEEALDVDICVLGSNQEETGGDGALVAAYAIAPDCAVAVDVTFAVQADVSKNKAFSLGSGAVIGVGPNMARWMTERFKTCAKKLDMPLNLEIMSGNSGTNGWDIQTAREGIATQVISIPLRYMHTPMEVMDLDDLERTAQLLAEFLRGLGKEVPEC